MADLGQTCIGTHFETYFANPQCEGVATTLNEAGTVKVATTL